MRTSSYCFIIVNNDSEEIKRIVAYLKYRKLNYKFPFDIFTNNIKYKVVLSNSSPIGISPIPPFDFTGEIFIKHVGELQVRMMYAGGKLRWNLGDWNKVYDYILCYGPYYTDLFKKKFKEIKTYEVGYPRFDSFFGEPINKIEALKKLGLDPNKKTITYLPTHGKLSSFEKFKSLILPLGKNYNVIIKPHPWLKIDPNILEKNDGVRLIDRNYNNITCFQLADFVFADYGGSVLGSIYADKNLLLLDVEDPLKDHLNMSKDSPDLIVRKYIHHIKDRCPPHTITKLLSDDLLWKKQSGIRKKMREKFFRFSKESGKIAASTLQNILKTS